MSTYLQEVCSPEQAVNPIFRFLGARLACASGGKAELRLPVSPNLSQGAGLVAGGVLATMVDECMAHAVISSIQRPVVTIELNIRYLRPARADKFDELVATAEVVKIGRTIATVDSKVFDGEGQLLVTAGASFYIAPDEAQ